jgi:hypothetical protein
MHVNFIAEINSILTPVPTYFMTIFKMPKWGLARIDRFRRDFLWKGKDPQNIRGSHCLVNWQTYLGPKRLGGLGIKDLKKFSRALMLRWLWHNWDSCDKSWKHLLKISDAIDREFF